MGLLAVILAAAALAGCGKPDAPEGAPNIIVVMTDDQAMNSFTPEAMPNVFELLSDGGTRFTDAYAIPPLCCPARAGFLTGQYPHNHGVVQNEYGQLRDPESTLPTWLAEGGYDVALTGKFMNEYHAEVPAPGFDHWWELRFNPGYYGYEVLDGDEVLQAGTEREDYSTLAVTREATKFIDEAAGEEHPFFLWASYYAPHGFNNPADDVCEHRTSQVLEEDWRLFRDAPVSVGAAFDERDISDKPPPSRGFAPLTRAQRRSVREDIRCNLAAVHRVDAGIGEIVERLRANGIDDSTAILFISDNGYFFGEHRRPSEKGAPYEAALEVPMIASIPAGVLGADPVGRVSEPTGTIDLAPTILELAEAEPCDGDACRVMDGRSLVDVMSGQDATWPRERARLSELGKDCGHYASVQRGGWMYTEWYEGKPPDCKTIGRELYDLRADPHQLDNLLGIDATRTRPAVVAQAEAMGALVARMRDCSGVDGRDETENPCS